MVAQQVMAKNEAIEQRLRTRVEELQWVKEFELKSADRHRARMDGMKELHGAMSMESQKVLTEWLLAAEENSQDGVEAGRVVEALQAAFERVGLIETDGWS